MGTPKFIEVMKYPLPNIDKSILTYLFDSTMKNLYEVFGGIAREHRRRQERDNRVKDIIRSWEHTYLVMAYIETLSATSHIHIQQVSITLSDTQREKASPAQLKLLQMKLVQHYAEYNLKLANIENKEPFLQWD
jgi:hypothetical protein